MVTIEKQPSTLTIRNLTATLVCLRIVQRLERPKVVSTANNGLFRNVTSILGSRNNSSALEAGLVASADNIPFVGGSKTMEIHAFEMMATNAEVCKDQTYRFIFEIEAQKHHIDICGKDQSQELVCNELNPKFRLTGVYIHEENFLTLYSSSDLPCWMRYLKNETPLSALSIPGTHNSPTCHTALPSVRCQAVSPKEQLDNGVRFFDVRVRPDDPDRLELVHGVFPISLTGPKHFRALLGDIYAFLDRNPSETLILSLKREGIGNGTDEQLGRMLRRYYTEGANARRWYVEPRIPTLGEARGRIVLIRRFCIDDDMRALHNGQGWALEAERWADNTACDYHGVVAVQDFYEVLETNLIKDKIRVAQEHLKRAESTICMLPGITCDADHPPPPQPFYLNFLSASNFWKQSCWPSQIAEKLNPAMVSFLCCNHAQDCSGDGGTGIVVTDWAGNNGNWSLIRCIVGMNSRLMAKQLSLIPTT